MLPDDMEQARERRYQLELNIPDDPEYFLEVMHAITGKPPRGEPVVNQYYFDEGEWVEKGEPIAQYEESVAFGQTLFTLVAPASGIVGRFAGRKDYDRKHSHVGSSLVKLPYGGTLVTIRLPEMHNIPQAETTDVLLSEMRATASRAKRMHVRVRIVLMCAMVLLALLGATLIIHPSSLGLARAELSWGVYPAALLFILAVGLAVPATLGTVRRLRALSRI